MNYDSTPETVTISSKNTVTVLTEKMYLKSTKVKTIKDKYILELRAEDRSWRKNLKRDISISPPLVKKLKC